MKRLHIFLALVLFIATAQAQVSDDFRRKFDQARNYMLEFQYEKASPVLEGLLEKDPVNANLQFLLGVCFTMGPVVDNRAISLLENAKLEVSESYNSTSADERKVPFEVHFYLAVAYAQSFNFEAANASNDKYHEYTGTINGKYMRDAKLWIDKMGELKEMLATEPVEAYDDTYGWGDDEGFADEDEVNESIASEEVFKEKAEKKPSAGKFYGVQIGAFAQSIPSYIFSGTENVRAYRGKEGLVRFVVGNVDTREQAEAIRDKMKMAGYTDAFIVHLDRDDFIEQIK